MYDVCINQVDKCLKNKSRYEQMPILIQLLLYGHGFMYVQTHWVYVCDFVEGEVEPGELRWLSQKVANSFLEVSQVSDVVVIEAEGAAQVFIL